MSSVLRRILWLFSRRRRQQELDEEIRFHLETERDEREQAGEPAAEARRQARIDFGNVALVREDTRAAWGWTAIEQLYQDLRYAARMMRRSPAFTALAVLSLALGIGVNTALFSFADVMLLRGLPVHDPRTLVRMTWRTPQNEMHGMSRHATSYRDPEVGFTGGVFSYAGYREFQTHSDLFSSVFAYQGTGPLTLNVHGQAEPGAGEYVSGDYFRGLGIVPAAGRAIDESDDRIGAPAVAILSFAFARDHFASVADAIGGTVNINTTPFTIVGIAPQQFFGTDPGKVIDLYLPLHANVRLESSAGAAAARYTEASIWWLEVMARRQPGVSLERAQMELAPPFQHASDDLKVNSRRWTQAPSLALKAGDNGIDSLRRAYGRPLVMLIGLAALILTLSCANIANLLLARAAARTREMAVRLSVGAGRARVARQLVTESLALSCTGGALGVGVAILAQRWMTALVTNGLPPFAVHAGLNGQVLGLALGLSVVTGLLFGLTPALQATSRTTISALKETRAQTAYGWRAAGTRRVLLIVQVAIALVMLMAAGLFLRTLVAYQSIERGYSTDHLLTFALRTRQAGLTARDAIPLFRTLRERIAALPGVRSAGLSDGVLIGDGGSFTSVEPAGREVKESSVVLNVDGGLLSTMQLRLVKGRGIEERDELPGAPPVAVVDETYVRKFFSGVEPIGQYVRMPSEPVANLRFQVVGVVANARVARLTGDREPTVYFPFTAGVFGEVGEMVFVIRTAGDPLSLSSAIRTLVHEADPKVPIARLVTQDSLIEGMFNREILLARLCTAFACLALAIAVVGLYGTVLQDVSRRRSEIGIRIALGAQRGQIVVIVLRELLVVVAIGLLVGVPAALTATRIAEALLFGVTRSDPITLALSIGVIVSTAMVAGFVPARAASQLNPTVALRVE